MRSSVEIPYNMGNILVVLVHIDSDHRSEGPGSSGRSSEAVYWCCSDHTQEEDTLVPYCSIACPEAVEYLHQNDVVPFEYDKTVQLDLTIQVRNLARFHL